MIQTTVKNNKLYASIKNLQEWSGNKRTISELAYTRLKNQINTLGQYKPVLTTTDGIVIGGNMRLKVYNELEMKEVWVSIVEFKEIAGKVKAFIDGQEQKKEFKTVKQAMLEYSLSDNDRAGQYDIPALKIELKDMPDIKLDEYSVDFSEPVIIKEAIAGFDETSFDNYERLDTKKKNLVQCPRCGTQFEA